MNLYQPQTPSRLLLPTVRDSKTLHNRPTDMLTLIARKKNQFERELNRPPTNDRERTLSYVRSQTLASATQDMSAESKSTLRDEMLSRGSTDIAEQQSSSQRQKLLKIELSTIVENHTNRTLRNRETPPRRVETEKARYKSEPTEKKPVKFRINQLEEEHSGDYSSSANRILKDRFLQGIAQMRRGGKNNERLERVAKDLEAFNPFFRKIQRVIAVCLLRVGRIIHKQPKAILYELGVRCDHFYIILCGRVKLKGHEGMHKSCEMGETILEEVVLGRKNEDMHSMERAKVAEDSYLLQIERMEFVKLEGELLRYGFKQGAAQLDSMIKRNHIVKNWLRNKYKLQNKD